MSARIPDRATAYLSHSLMDTPSAILGTCAVRVEVDALMAAAFHILAVVVGKAPSLGRRNPPCATYEQRALPIARAESTRLEMALKAGAIARLRSPGGKYGSRRAGRPLPAGMSGNVIARHP